MNCEGKGSSLTLLLCIAGRDVIAQAQSGTGKTATFSVAILEKIDLRVTKCQALILAPTRELAQQVRNFSFCLFFLVVVEHMDGRSRTEVLNSIFQRRREPFFFVYFHSIRCPHFNFWYSHKLLLLLM